MDKALIDILRAKFKAIATGQVRRPGRPPRDASPSAIDNDTENRQASSRSVARHAAGDQGRGLRQACCERSGSSISALLGNPATRRGASSRTSAGGKTGQWPRRPKRSGMIRENMKVERFTRAGLACAASTSITTAPVGVLRRRRRGEVRMRGGAARDGLAMHVAARNPMAGKLASRGPAAACSDDRASEKRDRPGADEELTRSNANKPANIVEKILEGKLQARGLRARTSLVDAAVREKRRLEVGRRAAQGRRPHAEPLHPLPRRRDSRKP